MSKLVTPETRKILDRFLHTWLYKCCNSRKGSTMYPEEPCKDCIKRKPCKEAYEKIHACLDRLQR